MSPLKFSTFTEHKEYRRGAFGYARVSSSDQAERRASIAEQRRELEALANRLGLVLLHIYVDEGRSASKDHENRDDFWQMVGDAKANPTVGAILVDEETRFFRDKYLTAEVKGDLLAHGIVVYTSTRTLDPRTMAGMWQESIEETAAHADTLMRREATMRGMKGNIRERDPETGWAFKNGGRAPYGWKNKRIDMGHDSRGRPIGRTIWELDPEAAKVRRQILMWRLEKEWSYSRIRNELNRQGIPAARGGLWSHTTVQNMFREDMLWTAAGYSIWNKHYRKSERPAAGAKFKPTSEWIVEPNAHPALITEEEAEELLALGKRRRQSWESSRGNERRSLYILSGDNANGAALFVCGRCGGRMVGNAIGVRGGTARRYICSTYNRHGRDYCEPVRIPAEELEQNVLSYIRERLLTKDYIRTTIEAANKLIASEASLGPSPAERRATRIDEIEQQVERAKRAILAGIDEDEWIDIIKRLRDEQQSLKVAQDEDPTPLITRQPIPDDDEAVSEIHWRLKEAFDSGDIDELRKVIRSFVLEIKLDPADCRVYAEFAPTWVAEDDDPHLAPMWYPQRDSSSTLGIKNQLQTITHAIWNGV